MKTYGRVAQGSIVELLATDGDIVAMFHPDLHWIDVTHVGGVACGWTYDGQDVAPPSVNGHAGASGSAATTPQP